MITWNGWRRIRISNPSIPVILSERSESKDLRTEIMLGTKRGVSRIYFVYILSNWDDSVLYIGVTSNLPKRLYEHRNHLVDGFTKKYHVHKLVCYENTNDVRSAIAREKQLKGWTRAKKNALIEKTNPAWEDLSCNWD